ncbi:hypothetical protein [Streptomyces sp. NPDC127040]|uniref:hypothetical protein n=1 Tax=Streptomyces sp. NPDC127040 TaxID=3347116 RepID=UPI003651C8FC
MHQRGYPDDRRTEKQRKKAAADPLGFDFEGVAGRVIARLTGETVVIQDDNSVNGMPDLRIEYADGRIAFGEVWGDITRPYAAMSAVLAKRGSKLAAPHLNRIWWVRISGRFNHSRGTGELPRLLADLTEAGLTFETVTEPGNLVGCPHSLARTASNIGVVGLASRPTVLGEEGAINFVPMGIGGPAEFSWESVLDCMFGGVAVHRPVCFMSESQNDDSLAGIRH